MRKKKLQQLEEEAAAELIQEQEQEQAQEQVEEPVVLSEDELKAKIDALTAEIATLEEKEDLLTDKLCLAKAKGLNEQTDRCRALLQRLVSYKNEKREELEEAKTAYREAQAKRMIEELSTEIDTLAEEIEGSVLPKEDDEIEEAPVFELEYDYAAKAKRQSTIAKAIATIGCFAALIGAVVYMIMVLFENLPFALTDLAIFGGVAVLMIVIALFVGGAARKNRRVGEQKLAELEEAKAQYEAECLERERLKEEAKAAWKVNNLDVVSEAYAIEQAKDAKLAKQSKQTNIKNKVICGLADVPTKLKENVNVVAPVATACTAAVAIAALSSASKKKAAAKRSAAIRRDFFDWLMK